MNWNAPKTSIVQVLFQFVYTVFQFIYKLFHSNSLNRQFGIIQENMNRCQFRNFVFRRLETNSSNASPLDLDKAHSDIISTCSANAGLTYTTSLTTIDTGGGSSGWKYYASILTPNGIIYVIPCDPNYIIRFDTNTDTYSSIGYGASRRFNSGALSPDLKYLYLSPCNVTDMYKLDLSTNELILYGQLPSSSTNFKYFSSITAPNGKIYMGSYNGLGMLEIDPTNDSYTVYVSGTSTLDGMEHRLFLDQDGNILSPISRNIYKFDTTAKTFSQSAAGTHSYIDYNMGGDGNYYGLGRYAGNGGSTMPQLSFSGQFGNIVSLSESVKRGSALSCLTPSGRIFYPSEGRLANPATLYSIGVDGSYQVEQALPYESFSCTLAPNGSVYCFSTNFNMVYKISFTYSGGQAQMFKESTLLSPLLNRG